MMRNELAKMESKVQVIEMTFPNHMQSNTHCKTNLQKKKSILEKELVRERREEAYCYWPATSAKQMRE